MIRAGDLCIDRERYRVTVAGRAVRLTYLEFRVLCLIAEQQGRVVAYEQLAETLWGEPGDRARRRLAVVLSRLRAKLGAPYIDTVSRVGYRLAPGPSPPARAS